MVLGSVGFFTLISLKACQILVPFKDRIVVEELIIEERKFTNIRSYLSKQNGQTISLGKDTCAVLNFSNGFHWQSIVSKIKFIKRIQILSILWCKGKSSISVSK